MSFNFPANTNQSAPANAQANGTKTPRTTVAYLNLYVPLADGTRMKICSDLTLRLYAERAGEVKLVDLIKSGVLTAEQIASMVQVEISLARDENAEIEFDLSKFNIG